MKVKLDQEWLGHNPGEELVLNDQTALALIERNVAKAVFVDPPPGHVTCTRCGAFLKIPKVKGKKDKKSLSEKDQEHAEV